MASRRTKVRRSLLALLVSYFRETTVVTTKFTTVTGVGGAYPFSQNVWTFLVGSQLYQVTQNELAERVLPVGVTVQFGIDQSDFSKAMPQNTKVSVRVVIRAPKSVVPGVESDTQKIALLVDKALYECVGRCEIKDYDVNPAVSTSSFLHWVRVPRGAWEAEETDGPIDELHLNFDAEYSIPKEEW